MFFASDNSGPAHPKVIEALQRANDGYEWAYGAEPEMARVTAQIRDIFEAPEAAVYLVATGTAANSLILATLSQPWHGVFCAPHAHIHEDECGAPEFFSGGAKLIPVLGCADKIQPEDLRRTILGEESRGVHGVARGPVSITQATERGTLYSLNELQDIGEIARSYDLPLHMDGARFANALVALGCSPAEMTWKAGIDALSFGGTKNGLLGAEAVVFFDPEKAQEFEYRRKRAGHLFSKHRYLSAQFAAYMQDDLWISLGEKSNSACAALARGLRQNQEVTFDFEPQANIVFATMPRAMHQHLHKGGAQYHMNGPLEGDPGERLSGRFVCDWSMRDEAIEEFLTLIREV